MERDPEFDELDAIIIAELKQAEEVGAALSVAEKAVEAGDLSAEIPAECLACG